MKADKRMASLPIQVQEQGPFGGRLISLAEACALADKIALEAERVRQEARERDAADWAWSEDLVAEDDTDPKAGIVTPSTDGRWANLMLGYGG
jgi:hypothetical protein